MAYVPQERRRPVSGYTEGQMKSQRDYPMEDAIVTTKQTIVEYVRVPMGSQSHDRPDQIGRFTSEGQTESRPLKPSPIRNLHWRAPNYNGDKERNSYSNNYGLPINLGTNMFNKQSGNFPRSGNWDGGYGRNEVIPDTKLDQNFPRMGNYDGGYGRNEVLPDTKQNQNFPRMGNYDGGYGRNEVLPDTKPNHTMNTTDGRYSGNFPRLGNFNGGYGRNEVIPDTKPDQNFPRMGNYDGEYDRNVILPETKQNQNFPRTGNYDGGYGRNEALPETKQNQHFPRTGNYDGGYGRNEVLPDTKPNPTMNTTDGLYSGNLPRLGNFDGGYGRNEVTPDTYPNHTTDSRHRPNHVSEEAAAKPNKMETAVGYLKDAIVVGDTTIGRAPPPAEVYGQIQVRVRPEKLRVGVQRYPGAEIYKPMIDNKEAAWKYRGENL